jgi:hypothetical protein
MKMRFLIGALLLLSCSESKGPIVDYHLVRRELHLGEYLKVENACSIITANRSEDLGGLVRVNVCTNEMTPLDASAREARDIFLSAGKIIYRVGSEVRLWNETSRSILTSVQKVRSFLWSKDHGRVTYETDKGEARWVSVKDDGKIIADGPLPGSGRATFLRGDRESLIFVSADGLSIGNFGNESEGIVDQSLIEKGLTGEYVTARTIGNALYVAYFDDQAGVLKIAKKTPTDNFSVQVVDGEPGKTYIGMDIAIFNDHGDPGLVYLDAWALKARWARMKDGHWVTEQLDVKGAVGFYNQVLEEADGSVTIALHNFRSQIENYQQTFENLAVLKLSISR